jgi:hypothetical protein
MLNSKKQITLYQLDEKLPDVSLFLLPIFFSPKNYSQVTNLKKFNVTPNDFCLKKKKSKHSLKFSKKKTLKSYFKSLNKKNLYFSNKKLKFLQDFFLKKKTTNNFLKNQYLKQQISVKINSSKNLNFSPIYLNKRSLKDKNKTNRFTFTVNFAFLLKSFEKRKKIKIKNFKSRLSIIFTLFSLGWRYNSFFFLKKKLWSGLFGFKVFRPIKKEEVISKSHILSQIKILKKKKIFCLKSRYLFNFLSLK